MKKVSLGSYNKRVRCYAIRTTYDPANSKPEVDGWLIPGEQDGEPDEPLPFSMP